MDKSRFSFFIKKATDVSLGGQGQESEAGAFASRRDERPDDTFGRGVESALS